VGEMRPSPRRYAVLTGAFAALALVAVGWSLLGHGAAGGQGGERRSALGSKSQAAPSAAKQLASERRARAQLQRLRAERIAQSEGLIRIPPPIARRVREVSVGFVSAYLRYETRRLGASSRRRLRTFSTAPLAAALLSAPVHIPSQAEAPRERVIAVEQLRPIATPGALAISASVLIEREGAPVLLDVIVLKTPAGLRVARLGR
jgi:hypothetical protein